MKLGYWVLFREVEIDQEESWKSLEWHLKGVSKMAREESNPLGPHLVYLGCLTRLYALVLASRKQSHQLRWPPGPSTLMCSGWLPSLRPGAACSALSAKPGGRLLSLAALPPFPSKTEGRRPALKLPGGGRAVPPRRWLPPSRPGQIPASQVPLRHPGGF